MSNAAFLLYLMMNTYTALSVAVIITKAHHHETHPPQKAEDARLLRDAAGIKASYSALHKINSAALNFHASREALHTQLLAAHKNLNSIIQDAAGLRVGGPKAKTLAACHQALQQGHGQAAQHLAAIIRAGMT